MPKRLARIGFAFFGMLALFWIWYAIAADYDYQALSGTYVVVRPGESCALRLRADRSFSEEVTLPSGVQFAAGKWRRFGEAGVEFSTPFLMLSDQEPGPGGQIYGEFEKTFTLFPSLVLNPAAGGPRLRRRLGRSVTALGTTANLQIDAIPSLP